MTPNDWNYCAEENQNCSFSGRKLIRYGNNGSFAYKERDNSIACNNGVFGDPVRGQKKFCHTKNVPIQWIYCAEENQKCNFSGASIIKYGTNNSFNYRAAVNSIDCNNGTFGDPIRGRKKFCYYMIEDDFSACASEGQTCSFKGTKIVRYGSGTTWNYREILNSTPCNSAAFGTVSSNNRVCQIKNTAYYWVQCAKENGTCSFTGNAIVRYGQNFKYNYRFATNQILCNNSIFGDPIVGVPKICEYVASTSNDIPPALREITNSQTAEPDSDQIAVQKSTS